MCNLYHGSDISRYNNCSGLIYEIVHYNNTGLQQGFFFPDSERAFGGSTHDGKHDDDIQFGLDDKSLSVKKVSFSVFSTVVFNIFREYRNFVFILIENA